MITLPIELLFKLIYQRNWKDAKVSRIELDKRYCGDGTIIYTLYANDDGIEISKEEYEILEPQLEKYFKQMVK